MNNNQTTSAPLDKSVFVNNVSNKTSIGFGEIKPINHKFLLPHDSIKLGTNIHVEMKPTNGRLNTKIRLRTRKYSVPIRNIWHGFDTWLTKNTHQLTGNRNSGLHRVIDDFPKSSTTPSFTFHGLTTNLLHCWGYGNPENIPLPVGLITGNISESTNYTLGITPTTYMLYKPVIHRDSQGVPTYADSSNVITTFARWQYKSIKDRSLLGDKVHGHGVLSGVNMYEYFLDELMPGIKYDDGTAMTSSNHSKIRFMSFTDPDTLVLANTLMQGLLRYGKDSGWLPSSFTDDPVVTAVLVSHYFDKTSDRVYWGVDYVINDKFFFGEPSSGLLGNIMHNGYVCAVPRRFFSLDGKTKFSDYYSISNLTDPSYSLAIRLVCCPCYVTDVNSKSSATVFPDLVFPVDSSSSVSITPILGFASQFAMPVLISAMFNRTLGKGSLMESLHVPYFQYGNIRQLGFLDCYALTTGGRSLSSIDSDITKYYDFENIQVWCPMCPRGGHASLFASTNYSALPFYAYQHIVANNYRLPNDVFQDVGLADIDSPYFMNMFVPTYYGNLQEFDIFKGSTNNTGSRNANLVGMNSNSKTLNLNKSSNDFHTVNQTLLIFFTQAPLIDSDAFTNMWRVQDRNVTATSAIGSYVSTALDAKSRYIADKMSHFWLHGGIWQDFNTMLQDHFKVRNKHINNDCGCEYLGGSNDDVALETIKATDSDHLGEMSTQAVTDIYTNSTEYFADDFEYLLELANLSVEKENFNTYDPVSIKNAIMSADDFRQQYFPEFQCTGDEPNTYFFSGYNSLTSSGVLGFTEKNNYLKHESNRIGGDYQDLNRNQIICLDDDKVKNPLELTYAYLIAEPERYNKVFTNYLGSAFTLDCRTKFIRQSCMSTKNMVGY